jgi:hypothetical protein
LIYDILDDVSIVLIGVNSAFAPYTPFQSSLLQLSKRMCLLEMRGEAIPCVADAYPLGGPRYEGIGKVFHLRVSRQENYIT